MTAQAPATPPKERETALVVGPDDGYTLAATLVPQDARKPRVRVTYRPALPEATMAYRVRVGRSDDPKERLAALLDLLKGHVVAWDLKQAGANGHPVPLPFSPAMLDRPAVQRALGMEYLDDMANLVNGYTAGEWEADAKNS